MAHLHDNLYRTLSIRLLRLLCEGSGTRPPLTRSELFAALSGAAGPAARSPGLSDLAAALAAAQAGRVEGTKSDTPAQGEERQP